MRNIALLILFTLVSQTIVRAQQSDTAVLFTVDDQPVYIDEFKRVYNKNLDLVKDESQKDVDAYLELFINYKLKLKEARSLGLHEKPKYKKEFASYRKQLAKNYLTDTEVTETLIKEAYDRTAHEIRARHILLRVPENAPAEDTLVAYNKLLEAKKEMQSGKSFEEVAKEYSEDPTVSENGGDLGYFGGFRMVYDFENAAFNTPVGSVSEPFRTRFGYHIVNVVDKRRSLGELTVAHIMVSIKKTQDTTQQDPEDRINDIYKKLQQGENFESLAKQLSEDKASAKKGGLLNRFGKGQLSSDEFEEAAFSLKEKGDVSVPIKSDFGWHIIKLIEKHPVSSFDEMKKELEAKIQRGSRSKLITSAFTDKLKRKYKLGLNREAISYFGSILNEDFYKRVWKSPENLKRNEILATIGSKSLTYEDFANFLMSAQRKTKTTRSFAQIAEDSYNEYLDQQVLRYYEDNLETENNDFKIIVEEYRDGLLLFDLMESEVWNAAKNDSLGLQSYFAKNVHRYEWRKRVVADVASTPDRAVIKKVAKYLSKGWTPNKIKESINKNGKLNVIFTKDTMDIEHQALPKPFDVKMGVSKVYEHNDSFVVVDVHDIIESSPKTFEEAKGKVISDYQAYIEESWINSLRKKFKVNINENSLARAKKEITE